VVDWFNLPRPHSNIVCVCHSFPLQDATTIRKAIVQIKELTAGSSSNMSPQALNQSTRWIVTKEEHATKIIDTVSTYFLTQKVGIAIRRHYQRCHNLW